MWHGNPHPTYRSLRFGNTSPKGGKGCYCPTGQVESGLILCMDDGLAGALEHP